MPDAIEPKESGNLARVLVIEDEESERLILCEGLEQEGYIVLSCTAGEEGLRLAQETPPDLILLDIQLKEMDGFEVCGRLKADPRTSEILVIFLSALQQPPERVKGLRAGAVDYITKPYLQEEVLARVSIHLEIRRTRLRLKEELRGQTKALENSRQLLEVAIAQSPSGILVADAPDVTIRFANAAALGIRGGNPQLLTGIEVGRHAITWQTFRPDGSPYPPEELPLSRAVLRGETTRNEEVIIRDEDGHDHWVSVNASPVRDPEGRVSAGIALFHDITEIKRSEVELRDRKSVV